MYCNQTPGHTLDSRHFFLIRSIEFLQEKLYLTLKSGKFVCVLGAQGWQGEYIYQANNLIGPASACAEKGGGSLCQVVCKGVMGLQLSYSEGGNHYLNCLFTSMHWDCYRHGGICQRERERFALRVPKCEQIQTWRLMEEFD